MPWIAGLEVEEEELKAVIRNDDGSDTEIYIDLIRHQALRLQVSGLNEMLLAEPELAIERNCGTCVGACCMGGVHNIISVTHLDMERIAAHKLGATRTDRAIDKFYTTHMHPMKSTNDFIGSLKLVKNKHAIGGTCCTFLDVDPKTGAGKCSVYEARPRTCSQFPAHNCQVHVPLKNLLKKTDPLAFRKNV